MDPVRASNEVQRHEFGQIPVSNIAVPPRRRVLRNVDALAESIALLGLLNPITVAQDCTLITGYHRLQACKQLGWSAVPSIVVSLGEMDRELAEIDENLMRNELTVLERAEHLKRRKEIAEARHPETKRGVAGGKAGGRGRTRVASAIDSFAMGAAARMCVSPRSVQQDVQIATNVADDVREALHGTPLADSKSDLMKLARLAPDVQRHVVETIVGGHASSVRAALFADARAQVAAQAALTSERAHVRLAPAKVFLESLAPESVDLLVTDPPYMTDVEDIGAFASEWVPLALSRVKPNGRAYICTGAYPQELHAYLGVLLAQSKFTVANMLVWTYRNTLGPAPKHDYKLNWQAIFHLRGADAEPLACPLMTEQFAVQDINAPDGRLGNRYHAWQKPDELAERLVRHATREGDLVVDPFAGTGAFLLAAARLGRRARGSDISEANVSIAVERGCLRAA